MSKRIGWCLAALAMGTGLGFIIGAVHVAADPVADTPVVCVMAAAAQDGVPVPAPHAWESRCR